MNQDAVNDEKVKKKIRDTYLLLLLSMLLSLYLLFHVVYIYPCLPPPPPLYLTISLSIYCSMQ